jgi:hypothetical protein
MERLTELAASLRKNNFIFAARAIQSFIDGNANSLDEAFGITPKKRRGLKYTKAAQERDAAIFRLRSEGASWDTVAAKLGLSDSQRRNAQLLMQGFHALMAQGTGANIPSSLQRAADRAKTVVLVLLSEKLSAK